MLGEPTKDPTKRLAGLHCRASSGAPTCEMMTSVEHDDPVGEGHCLGLIVRYINHRGLEFA